MNINQIIITGKLKNGILFQIDKNQHEYANFIIVYEPQNDVSTAIHHFRCRIFDSKIIQKIKKLSNKYSLNNERIKVIGSLSDYIDKQNNYHTVIIVQNIVFIDTDEEQSIL